MPDAPALPKAIDLGERAATLQQAFASVTLEERPLGRLRLRTMEDFSAPWHVHADGAEIFYVIEGRFWMDFDWQSAEVPVEVPANHLLTVPPGFRHRARATGRVTVLVMDGFKS